MNPALPCYPDFTFKVLSITNSSQTWNKDNNFRMFQAKRCPRGVQDKRPNYGILKHMSLQISCGCKKVCIGETGETVSVRVSKHIREDKKSRINSTATATAEHTHEICHSTARSLTISN